MNLKPERKLLVRILDLKTGESRNFSIYGKARLEEVYRLIRDFLGRVRE